MSNRPLLRARHRVLVVNDGDRVLAICLEENLVGCGDATREALDDLTRTVAESWQYWYEGKERDAPNPDPDPELLRVFHDKNAGELPDGEVVLARMILTS